jgi:hypothetical protein
MLQHMPIGTPIIAAPSVTDTEPTIIGKMPNLPWLGAHSIPNTKSNTPTLAIMGTPLTIIKTVMSANTDMDDRASAKNMRPDSFSLNFFMSNFLLTILIYSYTIISKLAS